jgi:probable rRNA maturation factor
VKVHLSFESLDDGESESTNALNKLEGREDVLGEIVERLFPGKFTDQEAEVSIAFVSAPDMQEKNYTYRGIDEPTDVLSFPMWEDQNGVFLPPSDWDVLPLGDILICEDVVRENAHQNGTSYVEELYLMVAHGFLHLLGMDHDTEERQQKMWLLQSAICKEWLLDEKKSHQSPSLGGEVTR